MADTPQESAMKAESEKPRPYGTGYKLIGKRLHNAGPGGEGDGTVRSMPRIFARRECCFAGWC